MVDKGIPHGWGLIKASEFNDLAEELGYPNRFVAGDLALTKDVAWYFYELGKRESAKCSKDVDAT